MVEDALEEGEIEGLVNESPSEQVRAEPTSVDVMPAALQGHSTKPEYFFVLQERAVHPPHDQGGLHAKKRTKKQKKQNGAKDSSKAYYDVYGQEVSAVHTAMSAPFPVQLSIAPCLCLRHSYISFALQARAGIQIDYAHPIRIADVQNLVLWTLADGTSPHWAFLKVMFTQLQHSTSQRLPRH